MVFGGEAGDAGGFQREVLEDVFDLALIFLEDFFHRPRSLLAVGAGEIRIGHDGHGRVGGPANRAVFDIHFLGLVQLRLPLGDQVLVAALVGAFLSDVEHGLAVFAEQQVRVLLEGFAQQFRKIVSGDGA